MGDRYDRYDRYEAKHRYDYRPRRDHHYGRPQSYSSSHSQRDGGYTFQGAAERRSERYPPHYDFDFQAPGPPAPRFPEAHRYSPPRFGRGDRQQRVAEERPRRNRRPPPAHYDRAHTQRGRGGFRTRAAHSRDILKKSGRESTPEQLEGMNIDGQEHFKEVDSGSEIGVAGDNEEEDAERRKRTKFESSREESPPKWSNPDPYTVLPPPETLGAPKKDIVQLIRKAKVSTGPKAEEATAVKENADFISFNFDEDPEDGDMSDESEALTAPSGFNERGYLASRPSQTQPSSLTLMGEDVPPPPPDDAIGGLPEPLPGFVMPTDEELVAQYIGKSDRKGKRKHANIEVKGDADVLDEWQPSSGDITPWAKIDHSRTSNIGLRLHKEISDFYEFVKPYYYEAEMRRNLVDRVAYATRTSPAIGSNSVEVKCFGSFAAGLYLPTADMDLVAVSSDFTKNDRKSFCQTKSQMFKLSRHLERVGIASPGGVAVVWKARVPIIKFADKTTGIRVDISFENNSGLLANKTFQEWKDQYPAMPVLVVLIKQMLVMRGLSEVYHGGIGGFTIICLVVSMMQLLPEVQSGNMNPRLHYGDLLLNFLDLYGNKFDILSTGITLNPPGYFNKADAPRTDQKANRLTIIDPNKPDNDISGGSHKIDDVLDCFRKAHSVIQRRLARIHSGQDVEGSILGSIWGGNYTSFIRQREKLSLLHGGSFIRPPLPAPLPAKGGKDKKQTRPDPQQPHQATTQTTQMNWRMQQHQLQPKPGATSQQPPILNGSKSFARKTERGKHFAEQFKNKFPGIQGVPDLLSWPQVQKLAEQHNINVGSRRKFLGGE